MEHVRTRQAWDSWTRARANRGRRARSSIPRVLEKSYLSMRKRLGGRSTLEQGSTRILVHLGNSIALESLEYTRAERAWLCLCSSRASTVVPLLEHAEHRSMLCSSMLVHNTRPRNCNISYGFKISSKMRASRRILGAGSGFLSLNS